MVKIRSFIAIEIPDKIKTEINIMINQFAKQDFSVQWVKYNNLHITLLFLGEVDQEFIDKSQKELAIIAGNEKPFEMSLSGIGAFPDLRQPRVIWIGVQKGAEQMINLQGNVKNSFSRLGYKQESRKFHPHLTIGRVKFRFTNPKVFEKKYTSESFLVQSVVLFKSILEYSGPIYEKLGEHKF